MRSLLLSLSLISIAAGCVDQNEDDTFGSTAQTVVAVSWINAVGVTATGNNLTKTGAPPWNAGAVSVQSILGNGFVEFTTAENTTAKAAGLAKGDTDWHYADIELAILLRSNKQGEIYGSRLD